jgi:acyl carrier protein
MEHKDQMIFSKLKKIIEEALRIDPAVIITESRLITDLKAESIDLLDIRFRIEQGFQFKIPDGELVKQLGKDLSRQEIEERLTVASLVVYIRNRLEENEMIS